MRCCVCHHIGVEVHHIVPQYEGGDDTIENAAPLCPTCHETYGDNKSKRKFIREARDNWYNACGSTHSTVSISDLLSEWRSFTHRILNEKPQSSIKTLTLGELLAHIYNSDLDHKQYSREGEEFLFTFFFGGVISEDFDSAKEEFLALFGKEFAKRCCGFFAAQNHFNLEGFIEPEMNTLATELLHFFLIVIQHDELVKEGNRGVRTALREDGQIIFSLAPNDSEVG